MVELVDYLDRDKDQNFAWGSVHIIDHTLPAWFLNTAFQRLGAKIGCFEVTFEEQRYYAGIMTYERARGIASDMESLDDPENKILKEGLVIGEGESRIVHSRFSPIVTKVLTQILG